MARLGGCLNLAMMMTLALVCFAFPTSYAAACGPIKSSAWGYYQFSPFDHSGYDGIKSIKIWYGGVIDALQVTYVKNRKMIETPKVGGSGGNLKEIKLDYPREYLFHIQGSVGFYGGTATIKGLKLYTNYHTYGPFGWGKGHWRTFSSLRCGNKIVGFHGDASQKFLANIGVYLD